MNVDKIMNVVHIIFYCVKKVNR